MSRDRQSCTACIEIATRAHVARARALTTSGCCGGRSANPRKRKAAVLDLTVEDEIEEDDGGWSDGESGGCTANTVEWPLKVGDVVTLVDG
jgi:hypothetical protein